MSDFFEKMTDTLNEDFNESVTENGAIGYKTTGKELLDLNFAVASLRKQPEIEIERRFGRAYVENSLYALKWLMYCRDVREGLGERRTPRVIFNYLADIKPDIAKAIIPLIPEYGRFDDLLEFIGTSCEKPALELIKTQLSEDLENMQNRKPISLLGKWLPSENASSGSTVQKARIVRRYLGYSDKKYRKTLTKLREYLDVVEVKMSAKEWDKIKYETVPSKANLIYNSAFLRNDENRRRDYLSSLEKGETKINASVAFPHDIVHKYIGKSFGRVCLSTDATLEAMWMALPNTIGGNGNTLVVRDGSASMRSTVDNNSKMTALEVSTALAIYFSEKCGGGFKDKFITFSSRPSTIDLSKCKTLADKINRCYQEDDCSNTDIEKTFDLILQTAINNHMKQEDMPKNVLIISDMEFDYATTDSYGNYRRSSEKLFDIIGKKFEKEGYKLPRLVFWNVNSRTGTVPVKQNELGVALVSGFSVNVCQMVLSGEIDPYKCLIEQLDKERYMPVEKAVAGLL